MKIGHTFVAVAALLLTANLAAAQQSAGMRQAQTSSVLVRPASYGDSCDSCLPTTGDCYGSCGCESCCDPCLRICLPSPCLVFDRVGEALYGLRELFRCRCCCDSPGFGCCGGYGNCCGVVTEQMILPPPRPATESDYAPPMPAPAEARRMPVRRTCTTSAGRLQYRFTQQPTEARKSPTPAQARTSQVQQTSYESAEPVAARSTETAVSPRTATHAKIQIRTVEESAGSNPLR